MSISLNTPFENSTSPSLRGSRHFQCSAVRTTHCSKRTGRSLIPGIQYTTCWDPGNTLYVVRLRRVIFPEQSPRTTGASHRSGYDVTSAPSLVHDVKTTATNPIANDRMNGSLEVTAIPNLQLTLNQRTRPATKTDLEMRMCRAGKDAVPMGCSTPRSAGGSERSDHRVPFVPNR